MSTVELDRPPSTGDTLRRALLGLLPGRHGGSTLPDTELVLRDVAVDLAELASYDRICGFRLSDLLPATYPHVLAFPLAMRLMTDSAFPFPAIGLVHTANRITLRRPVQSGERLDLTVRAAGLRPHPRGSQFDLLATASVAGEPVWAGASTYLRRHGGAGRSGAATDGTDGDGPPTVGVWRVPTETASGYARISGDRNPIHTSTLAARAFGFRARIAHGMWSTARCLAALDGRLPEAYTVVVEFRRPVTLPATVAFGATGDPGAGWRFALTDPKTGRPHLRGTVDPADVA